MVKFHFTIDSNSFHSLSVPSHVEREFSISNPPTTLPALLMQVGDRLQITDQAKSNLVFVTRHRARMVTEEVFARLLGEDQNLRIFSRATHRSDKIDHVVVLMLENRSFDAILGFLYQLRDDQLVHTLSDEVVKDPPVFDGLSTTPSSSTSSSTTSAVATPPQPPPLPPSFINKYSSKPNPDFILSPYSNSYSLDDTSITTVPANTPSTSALENDDKLFQEFATWPPANPGEPQEHTLRQLYGSPGNTSPAAGSWNQPPTNEGFIEDYKVATQGKLSSEIMSSVPPSMVPVTNTLAYQYAVSDRWFSSVPSQTWTNRLMSLGATSHGVVVNEPYSGTIKHLNTYPVRAVMAHMDEWQGSIDYKSHINNRYGALVTPLPGDWSWAVYTHVPETDMVYPLFSGLFEPPDRKDRYKVIDELAKDASSGNLPGFSLVEPLYFANMTKVSDDPDEEPRVHLHNDQHPAELSENSYVQPWFKRPPVWESERLVLRLYKALFGEDAMNPERTLLIVTYDEHGGCYDHVPPPEAVPPHGGPTSNQFNFQRLGVRVPTIFISPKIRPHTVLRPKEGPGFDHTSIISSLRHRWRLPDGRPSPPMSRRDDAAPDFWHVFPETESASGTTDSFARKDERDIATIADRLKESLEALDERLNKIAESERSFLDNFKLTGLGYFLMSYLVAKGAPRAKRMGLPFGVTGGGRDLDKQQGPEGYVEQHQTEVGDSVLDLDTIVSNPAQLDALHWRMMNALPPDLTRHALVVAIDEYPGDARLHGAVNDGDDVVKVLKRFGFVDEHISYLRNKEATHDNILKELKDLSDSLGEKDVLAVYFAGHGSRAVNPDSHNGYDETIVPFFDTHDPRKDIHDKDLKKILESFTCLNIHLIFDSCHSGDATRELTQEEGQMEDKEDVGLRELPPAGEDVDVVNTRNDPTCGGWFDGEKVSTNYVVISACRDLQRAREIGRKSSRPGGLFTQSLVSVVNSLDVSVLENMSWHELYQRTIQVMREKHPVIFDKEMDIVDRQEPQLEGLRSKVFLGSAVVSLTRGADLQNGRWIGAGVALGSSPTSSRWDLVPMGAVEAPTGWRGIGAKESTAARQNGVNLLLDIDSVQDAHRLKALEGSVQAVCSANYFDKPLKVFVDPCGMVPGVKTVAQQCVTSSAVMELAKTMTDADVVLTVRGLLSSVDDGGWDADVRRQRIGLALPDGQFLPQTSRLVTKTAEVLDVLGSIAWCRGLQANVIQDSVGDLSDLDSLSLSIRTRVSGEFIRLKSDEGLCVIPASSKVDVFAGTTVQFRVYLTVICVCDFDASVEVLYPPPGSHNTAEQFAKEKCIFSSRFLGENSLWDVADAETGELVRDCPRSGMFIAIASSGPCDVRRFLEQPPVNWPLDLPKDVRDTQELEPATRGYGGRPLGPGTSGPVAPEETRLGYAVKTLRFRIDDEKKA